MFINHQDQDMGDNYNIYIHVHRNNVLGIQVYITRTCSSYMYR